MRFSRIAMLVLGLSLYGIKSCHAESSCASSTADILEVPFVGAKKMIGQNVADCNPKDTHNHKSIRTEGTAVGEEHCKISDVYGCCSRSDGGDSGTVSESMLKPQKIGSMAQFSTEQALEILDVAKKAWSGGSGAWPQMSLEERIKGISNFLTELQKKREDIVQILMWEIGKNRKDAESEFDRTVQFAKQTIDTIRSDPEFNSPWQTVGKVRAFVRRAAIGIIMALGPYNYPLNETYATIIPALLMGNVVILKIPTVGGLAHLHTMEAFASTLPPGTVGMISGSGRKTMPPLMATGAIDGLAFIGGAGAADDLISKHPHPHRLKLFLQLEGNNMGIYLPDLFEDGNESALEAALDQTISGALSFNGQRCTALKLLMVPKAHSQTFAKKLAQRVEKLTVGLPWETHENGAYSKITPLPNQKRISYMKSLLDDATGKGAIVMNSDGGSIVGGVESTLMKPAVLHPVTSDMALYDEEQFGPLVPVAPYESIDEVLDYGRDSDYGQQCSIFSVSQDEEVAAIIDRFSSVFGKINLNVACGRSPDTLPFSGRRSSALGVMSVSEALREFSIPTVVSYVDGGTSEELIRDVQEKSEFLQPLEGHSTSTE